MKDDVTELLDALTDREEISNNSMKKFFGVKIREVVRKVKDSKEKVLNHDQAKFL